MSDIKENKKILLTLKNAVILPNTITPVLLGKPHSIKALEYALEHNSEMIIFFQKNNQKKTENISLNDLCYYGTLSKIIEIAKTETNNIKVLFQGIKRVTLSDIIYENELLYGIWNEFEEATLLESEVEIEITYKEFCIYYKKYAQNNKKLPELIEPKLQNLDTYNEVINVIAHSILQNTQDREDFLNCKFFEDKIAFLVNQINRELTIIEVEKKIKTNLQNQLETTQKEFYLKEQLKAIQKELHGEDRDTDILLSLKEKALLSGMPAYAIEVANKEIDRLEDMQEFSAEATVTKTYIDWLISLPWNKESEDNVLLINAKEILENDHYGLEKIKEKIIEYIAAFKYAGKEIKKPIICLIGPPGVGKTSLSKSIAQALNRSFVRIALGGIRDEADIRGHRKTYVASMPGKIIQAFKKSGTINPVILLDEIDKMSNDYHGNPAAALLEVLDPEQNKEFMDSFIEIPYDISQAIFIATANSYDNIPYALIDRLDIINLSGYTTQEKLLIVKKHILPKILKEHLLQTSVSFTDKAILEIINNYTREAGLRNLERILIKIVRKIIASKLLQDESIDKNHIITEEKITEILKFPLYKTEKKDFSEKIGISNGLAWAETGGDILEIEVAITPGKGNIQLTGQLGEIMQESAYTALTYIKSKFKKYGISKKIFCDSDIHIHVPEGAIPKDGPSAGIALCTALASALTNIPIKAFIAMTGEITLQGRILPIGGLKSKVLAAEFNNFSLVILPEKNKLEMEEILKEISPLKLKIEYCNHIEEVFQLTLKKNINSGNNPKKSSLKIQKNKKDQIVQNTLQK